MAEPAVNERNIHNFTATNMRSWRTALMRLAGGGVANIFTLGDSFFLAALGLTAVEDDQIPRRAAALVAARLGVPVAGGFSPIQSAYGVKPDRWSTTGTVDIASGRGYAIMSAGSTATYIAPASTSVDITYLQQSAAFTYSIDAGPPVSVPAGDGTKTVAKHTTEDLPNTPHVVTVNALTSYVFLCGATPLLDSGIAVHNFNFGGSRAASGGPTNSWSDTTNLNGIHNTRKGAADATDITPDLVICNLGGNDAKNGDPTATYTTGMTTIRNWWPDTAFILTHHWEVPGTSTATWDTYTAAKYDLADSLDIALVDWHQRVGYATDAAAGGWVVADGVHPTAGASRELGRNLGELLAN